MIETIDLSKIGKKKPSSTTKAYPFMPDPDGELKAIVDEITPIYEQIEALNGGLEALEGELKSNVTTHMLTHYNGRTDAPSQIKIAGTVRNLAVQFQDRYYGKTNEKVDLIKDIIGEEAINQLFEQTFKIEIDGGKIPQTKAQRFVNALSKLCSIYSHPGHDAEWETWAQAVEDTLEMIDEYPPSDAVTATTGVQPKKKVFHSQRHTMFDAEQNIKLQQVMPMVTALKKKGVK